MRYCPVSSGHGHSLKQDSCQPSAVVLIDVAPWTVTCCDIHRHSVTPGHAVARIPPVLQQTSICSQGYDNVLKEAVVAVLIPACVLVLCLCAVTNAIKLGEMYKVSFYLVHSYLTCC